MIKFPLLFTLGLSRSTRPSSLSARDNEHFLYIALLQLITLCCFGSEVENPQAVWDVADGQMFENCENEDVWITTSWIYGCSQLSCSLYAYLLRLSLTSCDLWPQISNLVIFEASFKETLQPALTCWQTLKIQIRPSPICCFGSSMVIRLDLMSFWLRHWLTVVSD